MMGIVAVFLKVTFFLGISKECVKVSCGARVVRGAPLFPQTTQCLEIVVHR